MAETKNDEFNGTSFNPMNLLLKDTLSELVSIAANPIGLSGLASGFPSIDKITGGWQKGDLIIIAARPGMGKTAFIFSMIKNMAIGENIPIGFFSLELTNRQIVNRFIMNVCEISSEKLRNGQLIPYEWEQLDTRVKKLYEAPIYIDSTYTMSVQTLCDKAREMVLEKGVQAIFVDYIQLLTVVDKYTDNRYNEVNYISRMLKALAKELEIPVFAVSQMNRGIENRIGAEGKRPQLIDLRDSGTLCDDADLVCFIHRPEYYHIYVDERGNDLTGLAEIIIAKHRNGVTTNTNLRFKGEFCLFSNIEDNYSSKNSSISDYNSNNPIPF